MNKYSTALALKSYDERKNVSYRSPITALVIETSPVSDKQLRKETIKSKLKITVISICSHKFNMKENLYLN